MINTATPEIERFLDKLLLAVQQDGHAYAAACQEFSKLKKLAATCDGFEKYIVDFIAEAIEVIPAQEDPVHTTGCLRQVVLNTLAKRGFGDDTV